jgi:hypothetical protein
MGTMVGLLQARVLPSKRSARKMQSDFSPRLILRLIFFVYAYMMLMASAGVVNCEIRGNKECGNQWTQAFTVSSGAVTTLWAYITDNPIQANNKSNNQRSGNSRNSSPSPPPAAEPVTSARRRRE